MSGDDRWPGTGTGHVLAGGIRLDLFVFRFSFPLFSPLPPPPPGPRSMPSPAKVHLVLLIHGLWGCPAHLRVAKEELEAAWVAAHPAQVHAVRADADSQVSGPAEDPVITKTLKVSPPHSQSHAQSHTGLEEDGDGEELVIMIAGGMTSQLTYDGIDVCASRVAWEVRPFSFF